MVKSRTFYQQSLGFITSNQEDDPKIVFFNNDGSKLALYPFEYLVQDIALQQPNMKPEGFNGITLAFNAKSKQEVDDIFAKIEALGGKIIKTPQLVFWGGYSGYFSDLDGYLWEVAFWDGWQFDDNNMLKV